MTWREKVQTLLPAEKRVYDLMLLGKSTKEIANELFLAYSTIKNHKTSILKKLGVKNSKEVIIFYYEDQIRQLKESK